MSFPTLPITNPQTQCHLCSHRNSLPRVSRKAGAGKALWMRAGNYRNVTLPVLTWYVALSLRTVYLTLWSGRKPCPWIRHNGPPLALGVCFPVWGTWDSVDLAHLGQRHQMAQESGSRSELSMTPQKAQARVRACCLLRAVRKSRLLLSLPGH